MSLTKSWRNFVGSKRKSSNASTANSPSNISSPNLDSPSPPTLGGGSNAGFGRSNSTASQNTVGGSSNTPPAQHLGGGQFPGHLGVGTSPPMNQQGNPGHGYPRSALSTSPYEFNGAAGAPLSSRTPNGYQGPQNPFDPRPPQTYPSQYMAPPPSTSPYPNSAQPQAAYPYALSAQPHSAQPRLPHLEENAKSSAQLIVGIDFVSQ